MKGLGRWLESVWYGSGAGGALLRPLSGLYARAQRARERWYRSRPGRSVHPGLPVVVVGNVTVGGTGKTPLVMWLVEALAARGVRAGVVSRGYGRTAEILRSVDPRASWRDVGDEPLLLARRTQAPVVVAADRLAAARKLAALGVDVVVSDDGLQHLRLARDCEIAVVDAMRGFGNGRLLPAGPLREPIERLQRVDAIVVNGSAAALRLPERVVAPVFTMQVRADGVGEIDGSGALEPLASWRGRRVHAVAGIGNPARFFSMLKAAGLEPIEHAFADHHAFSAAEVRFGDGLPVLMTEKDAVKCAGFDDPHLKRVRASASFGDSEAERLLGRILERIGRA